MHIALIATTKAANKNQTWLHLNRLKPHYIYLGGDRVLVHLT